MAGDERYEAQGAAKWFPLIKAVVQEGIDVGLVQDYERNMAENMLIGSIAVESVGDPGCTQNHGWAASQGVADPKSMGLTQLIPYHLYSNENPYDPVTAIRVGLRTMWNYYRGYGNRLDLALMEHNTGDVNNPGKMDDYGQQSGGAYIGRVINAANTARGIIESGQTGFNVGPFPETPFNWVPPMTSRAYELYSGNYTQPEYYDAAKGHTNLQLGNLGEDKIGAIGNDSGLNFPINASTAEWREPNQQELNDSQLPQYPAVRGHNYGGNINDTNIPGPHRVELQAYQAMKGIPPDTNGPGDPGQKALSLGVAPLPDDQLQGMAGMELNNNQISEATMPTQQIPQQSYFSVRPAGQQMQQPTTSDLSFAKQLNSATQQVNNGNMAPLQQMSQQYPMGQTISPNTVFTQQPTKLTSDGVHGDYPTPVSIPIQNTGDNTLYGPLSTAGRYIIDNATGQPVRLASVAYGFAGGLPFGIWWKGETLEGQLQAMKANGFNSIRLPLNMEWYASPNYGINNGNLAVNYPDMAQQGLQPVNILDWFLDQANNAGLKVILDMHGYGSGDYMPEKWYHNANPLDENTGTNIVGLNDPNNTWNGQVSLYNLIQFEQALATRYANHPAVVGMDLLNEPHGPAKWGTGDINTDWAMAAEMIGGAVQQIAPNWLIVVEGTGNTNQGGDSGLPGPIGDAWWGGNLAGVAQRPVNLNNVVYSPHDYGPAVWGNWWLGSPDALRQLWENEWGYIARNNIAPIWVGEFGARDLSTNSGDGKQVRQMLDYLDEIGGHWAYWMWNEAGSGDTGGLMADGDGTNFSIKPISADVLSKYTNLPPDWGSGVPGSSKNGYEPQYTGETFESRPGFPPLPILSEAATQLANIGNSIVQGVQGVGSAITGGGDIGGAISQGIQGVGGAIGQGIEAMKPYFNIQPAQQPQTQQQMPFTQPSIDYSQLMPQQPTQTMSQIPFQNAPQPSTQPFMGQQVSGYLNPQEESLMPPQWDSMLNLLIPKDKDYIQSQQISPLDQQALDYMNQKGLSLPTGITPNRAAGLMPAEQSVTGTSFPIWPYLNQQQKYELVQQYPTDAMLKSFESETGVTPQVNQPISFDNVFGNVFGQSVGENDNVDYTPVLRILEMMRNMGYGRDLSNNQSSYGL